MKLNIASPSTHLCLYWTSFQHIHPLPLPSKLLWFPVQTALPWAAELALVLQYQYSQNCTGTCTVLLVQQGKHWLCFLLMSSEWLGSTTSQCQLLVEEEHSASLLSLHRKRDRNQLCCWDGTTHPGRVTCPRARCFYCSKHTTKGFWHSTTRRIDNRRQKYQVLTLKGISGNLKFLHICLKMHYSRGFLAGLGSVTYIKCSLLISSFWAEKTWLTKQNFSQEMMSFNPIDEFHPISEYFLFILHYSLFPN